jgi:hypothetical protein
MSVSEHDLELLETWLDGELADEQVDALRRRLSHEPALAQMADQLRADRQLRASAWQGLDRGGDIESLIARVRRDNRKQEVWTSRLQTLRQVSGIAAAIVLMFGAGWISRSRLTTTAEQPAQSTIATNQNPTVSAPVHTGRSAPGEFPVPVVSNDLSMSRSGNPNVQVSAPQSFNPLLERFDTSAISGRRPLFQVQVLDAWGKVQYAKPMESYSDAMQFADYIGRFQGNSSSSSPGNSSSVLLGDPQRQR